MKHPVKDQARQLAAHLQATHGITLKHGQALDALSAALGYANWNAAAAQGLTDASAAATPATPAAHTPHAHAVMDVHLTVAAAQKWLERPALPSSMGHLYPMVTDLDHGHFDLWADDTVDALTYVDTLLSLAYHPRQDPDSYFGGLWLARACAGEREGSLTYLLTRMAEIMDEHDDGPGELDSWVNDLLTESPDACHERLVQDAQQCHDVVALRVFIRKTYAFTALCRPQQLPKKAVPAEIDRGPMDGDRRSLDVQAAAWKAQLNTKTDVLLCHLDGLGYTRVLTWPHFDYDCVLAKVSSEDVPPITLFVFTDGVTYRPESDEAARILHADLQDAARHVRQTAPQMDGLPFEIVQSLAGAPLQPYEHVVPPYATDELKTAAVRDFIELIGQIRNGDPTD
ncbi:glyoxalase superfamily protein [Deinococcus arcticus]|uniref:Glyoxalase-related protein domain-containing protein n=1 Tax=Deinococcus arcticus TaxID=2136176 RepID=A0A2T3W3W5_9DEIO|nr:glyoxalase superfamily protein [Deinococcus arcticus]PTA66585.1 hypothetical protein C8263_16925 [Deinococcus arcticus]